MAKPTALFACLFLSFSLSLAEKNVTDNVTTGSSLDEPATYSVTDSNHTAAADVLKLGCGNCHGCGIEGIDSTRKSQEAKFNAACKAHGCSMQEHAVILAMAMLESDKMDKTDTSKGKDKGSSNFSPFNVNAAELKLLGCDMSCAQSLGQFTSDYNIDKALMYVLKGLRGGSAIGGACDFLNYHRDGSTGWNTCMGKGCDCDCGKAGCKAYKDGIADSANLILKHPGYAVNGNRVCETIPHI
jgi:hypothetical protein